MRSNDHRIWPRTIGKTAAWVLGLAALLTACGGGGGGGGGGDGAPPPAAPTSVSGQLTRLDARGDIGPAPADAEVQLVALGPRGEPGATLASARTDGEGRFQLPLPADRSLGLTLGVTASDGAGGRWRAVALNADAPVGPASEAVTQALFEALGSGAVAVTLDARLRDLYRNSGLWLSLLNPRQTTPAAAVEVLRTTLREDPAVAQALDELVRLGRVSSSLGDIGGLFGFVDRVVELNDSDQGLRIVLPRPVPGAPGEWTIDEFRPSGGLVPALPDRTWLQLRDDGVQFIRSNFGTPSTVAIQGLIGAYQAQSFRWTPGVDLALAEVRRSTGSLDFGGDGRADTLVFNVSQRMDGFETIDVLGERRRALRFVATNLLRIELSEGGVITVRGTERRWHLPGLGVVRSEEANEATDRAGRVTTGSLSRVAQRAVAGPVSWPGRVRLEVTGLDIPTAPPYSDARAIGLTARNQLIVQRFVRRDGGSDLALSLRPLGREGVSADIVIDSRGLIGSLARLSPDGRRIYVARSPELGGTGINIALPPAEAAAKSATITRYDATTLLEEARFNLSPIPSRLQPGAAFPRYRVRQLVVSPTDSTEFALSGVDAALVRGSTVVSALGSNVSFSERIGADGRPQLLSDQATLLGWDADRQELRLEINDGSTFSRAVPVTAAGLNLAAIRNAAPVLFTLIGPSDTSSPYDHVDRRRLFVGGYARVFDADSGALINDRRNDPDLNLRGISCVRQTSGQHLCLNDRLYVLDADLRPQRVLPLQSDLRRIAGSPSSAPTGSLVAAPDGSLLAVGIAPSGSGLAAYRLRFD